MEYQEKYKDTFRHRLKEYMQADSITIDDLGSVLDKSPSTIQGYLVTSTLPKIDVVLAIVNHYPNWSIKYLLTGQGPKYLKRGQKELVPNKPSNEKERTAHWIALKHRLIFDLEDLPLDGFQYVFQEILTETERLIDENEKIGTALKNQYSINQML